MDKEKRKKILEDHYGLVFITVKKWIKIRKRRGLVYYDKEELIGVATEALVKAIDSYRPTKGSRFGFYARKRMEWDLNKYYERVIKKVKDKEVYVPEEILENIAWEDVEEEQESNAYALVDLYEPTDEIDKSIYHELILSNYSTIKEVAGDHGVTVPAVKMRKQRLIKKLREELKEELKEEDKDKENN